VNASGVYIYDVSGSCSGKAIGGRLSYDPRARVFHEKFFNSVQFESMGNCPADPWAVGALCSGQRITAQGSDAALIEADLDPAKAPFTLRVQGSTALFQNAVAHAARPNPPGAPVGLAAKTTVLWRQVQVRWLAPDESGNRPYLQFAVQVRPRGATGAAWSRLADVPRQGTSYDLAFNLPAPVAGYQGWDVRACSVTALAESCTSAVEPDVTSNALTRQSSQKLVAAPPAPSVRVDQPATPAGGVGAPAGAATARPIIGTPAPHPVPNPILTRPSSGIPAPQPRTITPSGAATPPSTVMPPSTLQKSGTLH
jgi:hypothetical protein